MTAVSARALTAVTAGALRAVRSAALRAVLATVTLFTHAQPVLDVVHARHGFSDVLRATLVIAIVNVARERHLAVFDCHHNLKRVEVIILSESIVDVFFDSLVGSAIVLWSTSATLVHLAPAFGVFITEPRSDRV